MKIRRSRRVSIICVVVALLLSQFCLASIRVLYKSSTEGDDETLHRPTSRNTSRLPGPFTDSGGGVILFLHVPKTGGTTLSSLLSESVDHFHNGWTKRGFRKGSAALERALNNWTNASHCFELHSGDAPSYMSVQGRLNGWRKQCSDQGIPFFAFTVLREPAKMAISYFNFYHGGKHRRYKRFTHASEQDFLNHTLPNPQCLFLSRGEISYLPENQHLREGLNASECNAVYDALRSNLDWIGTTENLTTVTIPLLEQVLGRPLKQNTTRNKTNLQNFRWIDLSESGKQIVYNRAALDREMHEHCQKDFPPTMWEH